ncbi:MAG: hypothetical protein RBS43_05290 [Candidatus Cloacimonas sp.]|jgi:hypothetical protein|nr:hypothetical protein [Candidatus Cloacimonas sp.]
MDNYDDKMKERWRDRRKKSYNWSKLLIMVLALVAILYFMSRPYKTTTIVNNPVTTDSVNTQGQQADSVHSGNTP